MAAGLVFHDITTSVGVTFSFGSWVPSTASPNVGVRPAQALIDTGGAEILTAAQVVLLLGYLDGVEGKLDTLAGYVDTLETGNATLATKLDTLHSDIATTLAGYVDGLEALIGTTNTGNATLHTDLTGTLQAAIDTAKIGNAGALLTPKFKKITASASGATEIVAAVTSKKIRVLAWDMAPNAAVNAKWQSHTAGDVTGLYYMGGQGNGQRAGFNPLGWFETTAGEALDLNLSAAVAVGGTLVYVEV
jgi:hypothetical protein